MATERGVSMDRESVKLGFLMETAQSHQKLAEAAIEKLNEHCQGLEAIVRDEIRQLLLEELKTIRAEAQGAATALQRLKRAANARTTFWTLGITAIAAAITITLAWWVLPKPTEIGKLWSEREELASNIAVPDKRGARAGVRVCGVGRLYIRVELNAPRYGENSDYMVIKGY